MYITSILSISLYSLNRATTNSERGATSIAPLTANFQTASLVRGALFLLAHNLEEEANQRRMIVRDVLESNGTGKCKPLTKVLKEGAQLELE